MEYDEGPSRTYQSMNLTTHEVTYHRESNSRQTWITWLLGIFSIAAIVAICALVFLVEEKKCDTSPVESDEAAVVRANVSSFILAQLNTKIKPCDDFYTFACGNWLTEAVIPAAQSEAKLVLDSLQKTNNKYLQDILESSFDWPLVDALYRQCSSTDDINQLKAAPLFPFLDLINSIEGDMGSIFAVIANLHLMGMNINPFFSFSTSSDYLNSTLLIAQIQQAGLGLPSPFYLQTLQAPLGPELLTQYQGHIISMLSYLNETTNTTQLEDAANDIISIETVLANASLSPTEVLSLNNTYFLVNYDTLVNLTHLPWDSYLNVVGISLDNINKFNLQNLPFLQTIFTVLTTRSVDSIKWYLKWHLIHSTANYLSVDIQQANFAFYGTYLSGAQVLPSRWEQCVGITDSLLGMTLGRYFVYETITNQTTQLSQAILTSILSAFNTTISTASWLDGTTRSNALKKLSLYTLQTGSPTKWSSYEYNGLSLSGDDSFWNRSLAISRFLYQNTLQGLGQYRADPTTWQVTPSSLQVDYQISGNQIVTPSGVFGGYLFNPLVHPAINFGGVGALQSHYVVRGYDDQASLFDGYGDFNNWWTSEASDNWNSRKTCLINQYNAYGVDGSRTLSANIGDVGGLRQAFTAYHEYLNQPIEIPGIDLNENYVESYTNDQLFFISYAQSVCSLSRSQQTQLDNFTSLFAPALYRVWGSITNHPKFASTFSCSIGAPMAPPSYLQCDVW